MALAGCASTAPGPLAVGTDTHEAADLALVHVDVVDVRAGRVLRDQTVLVADGTIQHVGPSDALRPAADSTVDGTGAYLIPGLWDLHAHLRGDGVPGVLTEEWIMPLTLAHGVTGVRDMTSDCEDPTQGPVCLDQMRAWQGEIERGARLGPRLLALSSPKVEWGDDVTEAEVRQAVRAFAERGVDLVKVYNGLAPQAFRWVADEATTRGLDVAGHVPLRMTVTEASDAGLRSVEHARDFLFDCFPGSAAFRRTAEAPAPSTETMRGMVDEHNAAQCEGVFRAMVRNGTWYVPTHGTRRMEAYADDPALRGDPRTRIVPAPLLQSWTRDADRVVASDSSAEGRAAYRAFYEAGLAATGAAHRAGVRVLVGTDAPDSFVYPGSGVHDELEELVAAGLTPAEALRAATLDGAEFLRVRDQYGSVEPGKRADLVLLGANPLDDVGHVRDVRAVVLGGRFLDRAALDGLVGRAEAVAAALGGR